MTDPLDFDGLVEMGARVLAHNAGDDDMCWALYADDARAILSAVLPHVLAGPREALVRVKNELAGVPSILRNPVWTTEENIRVAEERVNRALALREAALARIDKLTEGMSREGETG